MKKQPASRKKPNYSAPPNLLAIGGQPPEWVRNQYKFGDSIFTRNEDGTAENLTVYGYDLTVGTLLVRRLSGARTFIKSGTVIYQTQQDAERGN